MLHLTSSFTDSVEKPDYARHDNMQLNFFHKEKSVVEWRLPTTQ